MRGYTPEIPTCRFIDPNLGGRLPYVDFDAKHPYELPCNALVEVDGFGKGVAPEYVIVSIPLKGCLEQRRVGLCPRNLGLDISPELRP